MLVGQVLTGWLARYWQVGWPCIDRSDCQILIGWFAGYWSVGWPGIDRLVCPILMGWFAEYWSVGWLRIGPDSLEVYFYARSVVRGIRYVRVTQLILRRYFTVKMFDEKICWFFYVRQCQQKPVPNILEVVLNVLHNETIKRSIFFHTVPKIISANNQACHGLSRCNIISS